ncbi:hypothetical protein Q7C36_012330 [Tachysurus vachellii]|uniref:E3 ubiquitin-protein ligase NEURL3 n=1 Tax=Tachysurus vachellii TaxID=175792 RepID=A0AA88SLH5_TACVA|nr:E3 ubiquitin-protein ligase NEURL3-like [Tachysurus vachellii]KAK2840751.1 hypothetical protein Q7C36_012330 [Tachysurus vachellii]
MLHSLRIGKSVIVKKITKMTRKDKVTLPPCTCGNNCLGPLTFHPEVKGQNIKLSAGDRRATRDLRSFRHGVTFSNRPLLVGEKVRMRVERSVAGWHGALRVGFTTVPPELAPMQSLAIPELTDLPGFWATPVPVNYCFPRTELTCCVTHNGYLRIQTDYGFDKREKMVQLDTSKPIWAMIDVYGQTSAVLLLGSEKKTVFSRRRSCHVPEIRATEGNCGYDKIPEGILWREMNRKSVELTPPFFQHIEDVRLHDLNDEESCVVCYSETACVLLDCGHSCLCSQCATRVIKDFGRCPLCRKCIRKCPLC